MSKVIGEGAYGCVHKPSLKCKDSKIISDYNDKISKIMKNEDAQTEIQEYVGIDKIDPDNKYHIKPEKCVPDYTYQMKEAVMKCKSGKNIIKEKEKYKLIVMKYGGPDLKQFFKNPMEDTPKNRERVSDFWIDAVDLFKAVQLFIKNGMIHHDLKPENIVYDENKHSVKIIDFGLLQKKDNIIKESKDSDYWLSQFHFNFPPELFYYNKDRWDKTHEEEEEDLNETSDNTEKRIDLFFNSKSREEYLSSVDNFITYVKSEDLHPQLDDSIKEDFLDFVEGKNKRMNHDTFLKEAIDTIDVYGLGLSLMYVLTRVNELMKPNIIKKLHELFMEMVQPDIRFRINTDSALRKYESIIQTFPKRKQTIDEKGSPLDLKAPPPPKSQQQSPQPPYKSKSPSLSKIHIPSFTSTPKSPSLSKIPIPSFTSVPSFTRKSKGGKSKGGKNNRSKKKIYILYNVKI